MRRLRNLLKSVQRQLKKIRNKGIFFITLRQKDPQLRLRILFIASSSRKILNCGRGGGRFLEKNQNFFRCFQNALRKWLLIQPENRCLSLPSPCTKRIIRANKGHPTPTVFNAANHLKIRLLYKTTEFTV